MELTILFPRHKAHWQHRNKVKNCPGLNGSATDFEVRVKVQQIQTKVSQHKADIIQCMREICAIPSMDSQIGPAGERVAAEMRKLGYEEVRFDKIGNILGRIGPS